MFKFWPSSIIHPVTYLFNNSFSHSFTFLIHLLHLLCLNPSIKPSIHFYTYNLSIISSFDHPFPVPAKSSYTPLHPSIHPCSTSTSSINPSTIQPSIHSHLYSSIHPLCLHLLSISKSTLQSVLPSIQSIYFLYLLYSPIRPSFQPYIQPCL